jgi:hypothetical protein
VRCYTRHSAVDNVTNEAKLSQDILSPGGNSNHVYTLAVDTLMHYRMVQNKTTTPACDSSGLGFKCQLKVRLTCLHFLEFSAVPLVNCKNSTPN